MGENVHDRLFRSTFSQVEHAAGILRMFLPPSLVARLNWNSLTLCPGSFIDEDLGERLTDLLFSILFEGRPGLLYLLFEHESSSTPLMAFRLLRYEVRIWDAWLKENPNAKQLPVIVPVVLHHSPEGWRAAVSFEELLDVDADLFETIAPYVPRFRFILDDISAAGDEELRDRVMSALGRLALWCLRHARSPEELIRGYDAWVRLVRKVLKAPNGAAAIAGVFRYILAVNAQNKRAEIIKLLGQATGRKGKRVVESVADELRAEGRQEGRQEGQRELLLHLLRVRFGEIPEAAVARVNAADLDQLGRWAERVLSAPTLDAVLAHE
jgi:predicted transposase YdaD